MICAITACLARTGFCRLTKFNRSKTNIRVVASTILWLSASTTQRETSIEFVGKLYLAMAVRAKAISYKTGSAHRSRSEA